MSKEDYRLQLDEYGFEVSKEEGFPRSFGSQCIQFIVTDYDELFRNILLSVSNHKSCYLSLNSYPWIRKKSRGFAPEILRLETIIQDLDCEEKTDHALSDLRNLVQVCDNLNLTYMMSFSGGKGFHHYILLDSHNYRFSFTDKSAESLKICAGEIQDWVIKQTSLRTFDPSIVSDCKRIIRLPYTAYYKKDGTFTGRYCIPLSRDQVLNWNMERIIHESENPSWRIVKNSGSGNYYEMEELVSFLEVSRYTRPTKNKIQYRIKTTPIEDSVISDILMLIKERQVMCCYGELMSENPSHHSRVFLMLFLMEVFSYRSSDIDSVIEIFRRMATEFNYADYSESTTGYQVESIVGNEKYQDSPHVPECKYLQGKGICIGSSCPRYHE